MIVKAKMLLFGCCLQEENPDSSEIDRRLRLNSQRKNTETHLKTENCTTSNINLTTTEADFTPKGPTLKLIAVEGNIVPVGKEFIIHDDGLKFGARRRTDRCTYIGSQKLAKNTNIVINDIVLEDKAVGEKHCMIKYNPKQKQYYIKDQGQGSGTFMKINEKLKVKNGLIISFSSSHMVIHVGQSSTKEESRLENPDNTANDKNEEEKDMLTIKFLEGPKAPQEFKFSSKEGVIRVGRMSDCKIKFAETDLSRYQCTLKYIDDAWYIFDGIEDKPSTNGTWIFIKNFHEINNGSLIKVGETLFKAEIDGDNERDFLNLDLDSKTR